MGAVNLKAYIFLPLALVSVLLLAAFVVAIYHEEQEHLGQDLTDSIQSV